MARSSRFSGYVAGLLASFFWGIHSVIIRYLSEQGVNPYLIAALRLYIGVLVLFVVLLLQYIFAKDKQKYSKPFKYNKFFWIGALSIGINFLFFQKGLEYTLASDANLIQNFAPVTVLILSSLFMTHRIREIAPNRRTWARVFQIVIIGSIGASLVLLNDTNNKLIASDIKLFGDALEFIGMIFFTIFIVCSSEFSKSADYISSLRTTFMTLAVAAIPVTFFLPFGDLVKLTQTQWSWIIFIGVFSTGIAYWLWHIASTRLNVIPLTLNLVYIGIITVLTEFIFLKMGLDWKFLVGGVLMISASVAAEIINARAQKYHELNAIEHV